MVYAFIALQNQKKRSNQYKIYWSGTTRLSLQDIIEQSGVVAPLKLYDVIANTKQY